MMRCRWTLLLVALLVPAAARCGLIVDPPKVSLDGRDARWHLLVSRDGENSQRDLTRQAVFTSDNHDVAIVTPRGVVKAIADGRAAITVKVGDESTTIPVTVNGSQDVSTVHFENEIIPIFSRYGCNSSGCHGKAEGQNGFKLSVFGFDPAADRTALIGEGRGRRVFPSDPDRSLLLLKAAGGLPHGGGVRISQTSPEYRTLRTWIAQGMPAGDAEAPHVVSVQLTPREQTLTFRDEQQLRVTATYSDGVRRDVTHYARFQSNHDGLAQVDERGLVTALTTPGDVAVMAEFMGAVDVFRALVPRPGRKDSPRKTPVANFLDEKVDAKLQKLNIHPSELCDDATFLRRVFLDIIGTLPTADEARAFLADTSTNKRQTLVDALLKRPEYADVWALKWADLLRVDRNSLGKKKAYDYYRWIRDSFARNKPYDQFARELLTVEGSLAKHPQGHFYRVEKDPGKRASLVSQVFLGVRIECAQCHHHPYDRWSQSDYAGMTAFFKQVGFKTANGWDVIGATKDAPTKHPRTGARIFAYALGTQMPEASPEGDRRRVLAEWMTAPDNPWFARNFVNRVWAKFLGRGIVEPVDDFRLTNPPTNPELLDALASDFVQHRFDIHHLIRRITASRTYQLSSDTNATNVSDEQNYSRQLLRRPSAEVLFDAVCQITGVPEKFEGVPGRIRAIQLWDSHSPHPFLRLFGRPVRATACECERAEEPSVSQVLHLLNSPKLDAKLRHADGQIAKWVRSLNDAELVEELYLACYARFPTKKECRELEDHLRTRSTDRRRAAEDIAWSMMNTVEFVFNH